LIASTLGSRRRLLQEADDHVEGLVGVVQQHVLLADRGEHVAVVILHAFGHAGGEGGHSRSGRVESTSSLRSATPSRPRTSTTSESVTCNSSMIRRRRFSGARRGNLQPDHLAAATAFQRGLEFADKVLGLVLDLKVAVAQHAEGAMAAVGIAGEQHGQMQQQQFLQRQEAAFAGPCAGRGTKRAICWGMGSSACRLRRSPTRSSSSARQKPVLGMKGKGCAGSIASGDSTGKTLLQEMRLKVFEVALGEFRAGEDGDALRLHLAAQGLLKTDCWVCIRLRASALMRVSCSATLRPSSDRVALPLRISARRPATRTV
jgi:hypothetical protein